MDAPGRLLLCCALAALFAVVACASEPQGRAALGASCRNNSNCTSTVRNSECKNQRCSCISAYEQNGTECVMKLNSVCNATYSCNRPGAQCVNERCQCMTNYLTTPAGNCVLPATFVWDRCEMASQCHSVPNTRCYFGYCVCNDNLFAAADGRSCAARQCTVDSACASMGHARCVNGRCSCQAGTLQGPTMCYKQIGTIGDKCNNIDEYCFLDLDEGNQNVGCVKGKCQCINNHKPDKKKKRCVSGASLAAASALLLPLAALLSLRA